MKFLLNIFKSDKTTSAEYTIEYEIDYVDVRLKSKYDYAGSFQKTINVRVPKYVADDLKYRFMKGCGYIDVQMKDGYIKTINAHDIQQIEILYDDIAYIKNT